MAVERVFFCDWRECENRVQTASPRPRRFLTVTEDSDRTLHFCSWDCNLKFAAEVEPVEVVVPDP